MPPEWIIPAPLTEADITSSAGFVYCITNTLTGKRYIGKKFSKAKANGKMKESKWQAYWGSCTALAIDLQNLGHDAFTREVLSIHQRRSEVDYEECRLQFGLDVLRAKMPCGEKAYYNTAISGRWFRA
ncbi:MAG: hypothetical protein ACSLE1_15825 [Sphingobium sp.]